jgi:hypothetical protein
MLGLERVAGRLYVTGDSFAVKDRLKAAGCHWDCDRRMWWIGAAKASVVEAIVAGGAPPEDERVPDDARVLGRGEYKGRTYYLIARTQDGGRFRLTTLDGKVSFWADASACTVTRTYEPRTTLGHTTHTTLGGLRRFIERQKNPATRRGPCSECGHWGASGEPCEQCGVEDTHQ